MRKVTQDEFFKAIGNKNVHPKIQGSYPYTSIWRGLDYATMDTVYGKTVDVYKNGVNGLTEKEYWLP